MSTEAIPANDLQSFAEYLHKSTRILALLGAGLSASSGLPTFRGAGGMWRNHEATTLATPEAFEEDPALVWAFYSYRRHMALKAKPNKAHLALAELARKKPEFVTLSQNVDGLSQRAEHPRKQMHLLHGSLFDIRCTNFFCNYATENFDDPIVPSLEIPREAADLGPSQTDHTGAEASEALATVMRGHTSISNGAEVDLSDAANPLPSIKTKDLPQCPECKDGLLRPGVVWFGEMLPSDVLRSIDDYFRVPEKIDLIMVIGTSAKVYPAAGYVDHARRRGARVAVVNMERSDIPGGEHGLAEGDWFFHGDAGVVVPKLLESVIGKL
ncbi:hypothetical protein MMC25_006831 [Agyrium rufum]|nr:hypothetical protein [Agyrium rufum]